MHCIQQTRVRQLPSYLSAYYGEDCDATELISQTQRASPPININLIDVTPQSMTPPTHAQPQPQPQLLDEPLDEPPPRQVLPVLRVPWEKLDHL